MARFLPIVSFAAAMMFAAQAADVVLDNRKGPGPAQQSAKPAATLPTPLDVVMITGLTGEGGEIGRDIGSGFTDAVRDLGFGQTVRLVVRDDGGKAATLATLAQEAAHDPHTLAMIGPDQADEFDAMAEQANSGHLVALAPLGAPPQGFKGPQRSWSFSLQAPNVSQGQMLARVLQRILPGGHVTRVVAEGAQPDGLWQGLTEAYKSAKSDLREIVWNKSADPASQIAAIPDLDATEAMVISLPGAQAADVIRTLRQTGYDGQIVTTGEGSLASFPDRFKGDWREAVEPGFYSTGQLSLVPFTPRMASAQSQRLVQSYRAAHKSEPSWAYATGHDLGLLVVNFLSHPADEAGLSGKDIAKLREAFRAHLLWLRHGSNVPEGLTGALTFDADGQRDQPMRFVVTHDLLQTPFMMQFSDRPQLATQGQSGPNDINLSGVSYPLIPAVKMGLEVHSISNIDFRLGTFDADFDVWFKTKTAAELSDYVFINQIGDLHGVQMKAEIAGPYTVYRRFGASGTFTFSPKAADVLLLRTELGLSWRHRRADASQLKLVLDEDSDIAGDHAQRRVGSDGFVVKSDYLAIDEQLVDGKGDPRSSNGLLVYSVGSYQAAVVRLDQPFMASLIQTLGVSWTQILFLAMVGAFVAVVLLRLRLRTPTVETVFYLLFLGALLFSECTLFITPLAERLGGQWLSQVPYFYDIAYTVVVVRAIDVVIARMMRGAISRTHLPPVMMPLTRAGLYGVGIAFFYTFTLGRDLWPVLATSSVLLTVVGLALSRLIYDAISGIAIATDTNLRKGQWVMVKTGDKTITGKIENWGWRQARIRQREGHVHLVPNSILSNQSLANLSMSNGYIVVYVPFEMSAEVPALEILPLVQRSASEAVASNSSVDPSVPVSVYITELEGSTLKCIVELRYLAEKGTYGLRTQVLEAVRKTLFEAGALAPNYVEIRGDQANPA